MKARFLTLLGASLVAGAGLLGAQAFASMGHGMSSRAGMGAHMTGNRMTAKGMPMGPVTNGSTADGSSFACWDASQDEGTSGPAMGAPGPMAGPARHHPAAWCLGSQDAPPPASGPRAGK